MLEWQTELKDPREFMEALKIDLFEDEVFVFTPKGDVISLKRGSTPIDFAYAIHTEVGNHCVGAKVNGSIVPLGYELQMGDRIEILTNKNSKPSRDWLNIVKTSSAKSKIRNYFSKVTREDDLVRGRDELAKVMRKHGLGIGSKTAEKAIDAVAKEMNYAHADDMLAAIGAGKISAKQVGTKLLKLMAKDGEVAKPEPEVEEFTLDKPMIAAAQPAPQAAAAASRSRASTTCSSASRAAATRCPGDKIIGFVTRGRGVSVHRDRLPQRQRAARARPSASSTSSGTWARDTTFQVEIFVEALDRLRLLQDVTAALAESGRQHPRVVDDHPPRRARRHALPLRDSATCPGSTPCCARCARIDGVFEARRMMSGEATQRKRGDR